MRDILKLTAVLNDLEFLKYLVNSHSVDVDSERLHRCTCNVCVCWCMRACVCVFVSSCQAIKILISKYLATKRVVMSVGRVNELERQLLTSLIHAP